MGLVLLTPASEEPLTLELVKLHCRVPLDETAEDELLQSYIPAAREVAEGRLRRALTVQQWRWTLDSFPCGDLLYVPKSPLVSVDSVKYLDTAGAELPLSSSNYVVDATSDPGRLQLGPNYAWPITQAVPGAVRIVFTAGWPSADAVPAAIKTGMALLIGLWYRQREQVIEGPATKLPYGVEHMWAPWRMQEFR